MTSKTITSVAALTILGAGLVNSSSRAQDKKDGEGPRAKVTSELKAIHDLAAAFQTIDMARDRKAPDLPVVAAKVIATTNVQKGSLQDAKVEKLLKYDADKEAEDFVKEAIEIKSGNSETIKSFAAATPREITTYKRGPEGEPKAFSGTLGGPDQHDYFYVNLRPNEWAEVIVR